MLYINNARVQYVPVADFLTFAQAKPTKSNCVGEEEKEKKKRKHADTFPQYCVKQPRKQIMQHPSYQGHSLLSAICVLATKDFTQTQIAAEPNKCV